MASKTDNANLPTKLELRRHFLRRYHGPQDPADVLECCQGSGVIWRHLKREFPGTKVWGLDLKERKGRLKVDSARVVCQAGWRQNIVDIDSYGSPWKHWTGMLPNVSRPITVFLTIGQWQMGVDSLVLKALGVASLQVPPGIAAQLVEDANRFLMAQALDYGLEIVEAQESTAGTHARYIGVRLHPKKGENKSPR
jgi:hypothetical protein